MSAPERTDQPLLPAAGAGDEELRPGQEPEAARDPIDVALEATFPASDALPWWGGREEPHR